MMEEDIILKAENISKQYRLGLVGTGTVSHDLNRWWSRVRGKEDPYLKIGEANDRSSKGSSNYVWALQDINFEVRKGEVLGIIGKNGAGKSTLLKILSKVTGPTTGKIKSRGRIASLLEVGTGFHPELTGRENIFLNGAILGMTKPEIKSKLDEIISFSGCERYIDTPVKRYSSGMKVRLAFAVAAHLEPEILVVDEVLAVGDAEFQKKAIGKMQDISRGQGRTVLFVSHNMAAVQNLCNRGMLLENGRAVFQGNINETISKYLQGNTNIKLSDIEERKGNGIVKFREVKVYGADEKVKPATGSPFTIELTIDNPQRIPSHRLRFDMRIDDDFGQRLSWVSSDLKSAGTIEDTNRIRITYPKNPLNQGIYSATLYMGVDNAQSDLIENAFSFDVEEGDYFSSGKKVPVAQSKVLVDFEIKFM
ncbi:ATP-binding cassette domain-containing protein [Leptobacterium flavescens]|uniref:ATP-binding cassette domain-containing protein n=1 Tax=Leptobacterium flavescens TaxID=472055 RepID=A0A6P0UG21_9FLAO|nr:ABC transporter ATP-binding protein [Leptobacterium flavescens]NER12185.1 ATP-binding cassette domain-containing protein [Leptobacterium flavescens]